MFALHNVPSDSSISVLLGLSLLSGAGTFLGAVLALFLPIHRAMPFLTGFAAGVMSGVIVLELLPASIKLGGMSASLSGGLAGTALLFAADMILKPPLTDQAASYRRLGWLLFFGIALHDFPEGMAIGTGGAVTADLGIFLAAAIGIHNLPEGLVNAAPLLLGGLNPAGIIALNALLSLVTPAGTLAGLGLAKWEPRLIPAMLALAAGAMAYIIVKELLPRMIKQRGTAGFITGLLIIILLL
ncbi:MAG: ZIP family metal transporter [Bacillota bacterium]